MDREAETHSIPLQHISEAGVISWRNPRRRLGKARLLRPKIRPMALL